MLITMSGCSTPVATPKIEPVVVEKTVNIYVTIPEDLLDSDCAEPAMMKHGMTTQDLANIANLNAQGIEQCRNVIKAIINYNEAAKKKALN